MGIISTVGASDKASSNNAVGLSSQNHVDRTSNGVLWAMYGTNIPINSTGGVRFLYSTNNGATWNASSGMDITPVNGSWNASIFIDADDYMHFIMQDVLNGTVLKYRRGTPNAGRTNYTWSGVTDFTTGSTVASAAIIAGNVGNPVITAHKEGTGYVVHVAAQYWTGGQRIIIWRRLQITSAGAGTLSPASSWDSASAVVTPSSAPGPLNVSIDFQHDGTGKTHAGVPSIFFSWLDMDAGVTAGLRMRKATWTSANTWSLGTERQIDNRLCRYSDFQSTLNGFWHNGFYDGTRYVMVGVAQLDNPATDFKFFIYERNAADSATTQRLYASSDELEHNNGAATYDYAGNVIVHDTFISTAPQTLNRWLWTRATGVLTSTEAFSYTGSGTTGANTPRINMKRGPFGGFTEWIGEQNGNAVIYGQNAVNKPPTAPTIFSPNGVSIAVNAEQDFTWSFNDPDSGDFETAHDIRYRVSGTTPWTTLINQTGSAGRHTFASGTFTTATNYEWQVATYDSSGLVGAWSSTATFSGVTGPATPTWIAPAPGGVISVANPTLQWSTITHTSYQIQVLNGTTVLYDSAEVVSAANQFTFTGGGYFPNGAARTLRVRLKNSSNVWGGWTENAVTVSYTVPANPTITTSFVDSSAIGVPHALTATLVNPAPSGSQPTVTSWDLHVREVGDTSTGVRIAKGLTNGAVATVWYEPKASTSYEIASYMYAANGVAAFSNWQAVTGQFVLRGFVIHDPVVPSSATWFKYNDKGAEDKLSVEYATMQYQGRSKPVVEFGGMTSRDISIPLVSADSGESEKMRALMLRRTILCYRDGKGRKVFGIIPEHSESDVSWGKKTSLSMIETDWTEGV